MTLKKLIEILNKFEEAGRGDVEVVITYINKSRDTHIIDEVALVGDSFGNQRIEISEIPF